MVVLYKMNGLLAENGINKKNLFRRTLHCVWFSFRNSAGTINR
jgi:hypothetical protein